MTDSVKGLGNIKGDDNNKRVSAEQGGDGMEGIDKSRRSRTGGPEAKLIVER